MICIDRLLRRRAPLLLWRSSLDVLGSVLSPVFRSLLPFWIFALACGTPLAVPLLERSDMAAPRSLRRCRAFFCRPTRTRREVKTR
jgi:hypothetical protein